MKKILYIFVQCTWGLLQSFLGLIIFIFNFRKKHYYYYGSIVTEWNNNSSVSLGLFVFITKNPYFHEKIKNEFSKEELSKRLLVHEYGHTIQSLILGPLYLIIMGIPSTIWGFSSYLHKKRVKNRISYFSFFTEKWANKLGEKITKQQSMGNLLID